MRRSKPFIHDTGDQPDETPLVEIARFVAVIDPEDRHNHGLLMIGDYRDLDMGNPFEIDGLIVFEEGDFNQHEKQYTDELLECLDTDEVQFQRIVISRIDKEGA